MGIEDGHGQHIRQWEGHVWTKHPNLLIRKPGVPDALFAIGKQLTEGAILLSSDIASIAVQCGCDPKVAKAVGANFAGNGVLPKLVAKSFEVPIVRETYKTRTIFHSLENPDLVPTWKRINEEMRAVALRRQATRRNLNGAQPS